MKKWLNALMFVLGAAAGSLVTWKILEKKYQKIAQEEIDSVKEVYMKRNAALTNEVKKAHQYFETNNDPEQAAVKKTPVQEEYVRIVKEQGYSHEDQSTEDICDAHVISPDEFGELDEYDTESLTYFNKDKVLWWDNRSKVVKNPAELLGPKALDSFGEYEDDSVFVRNDELKIDFEVLLDMRSYYEVFSVNRHIVDDDE